MKKCSLSFVFITLLITNQIHASAQIQSPANFGRHSVTDEFLNENLKASHGSILAKEIRRSHQDKRNLASRAWSIFFNKFLLDLPADWELPYVPSTYTEEDWNLFTRGGQGVQIERREEFDDEESYEDSFDEEAHNEKMNALMAKLEELTRTARQHSQEIGELLQENNRINQENLELVQRAQQVAQEMQDQEGPELVVEEVRVEEQVQQPVEQVHVVEQVQQAVEQVQERAIQTVGPIGWRYYLNLCTNFIYYNPAKCFLMGFTMMFASIWIYYHMPDVSRMRQTPPPLLTRIAIGTKEAVKSVPNIITSTPVKVAGGVGTVVTTVRNAISYGSGALLGFTKSGGWFNLWNPNIPNSGTSFKLHEAAAKALHKWYSKSAMKGAVDVIYEGGKLIFRSWEGKTIEFTCLEFAKVEGKSALDAFVDIGTWSQRSY